MQRLALDGRDSRIAGPQRQPQSVVETVLILDAFEVIERGLNHQLPGFGSAGQPGDHIVNVEQSFVGDAEQLCESPFSILALQCFIGAGPFGLPESCLCARAFLLGNTPFGFRCLEGGLGNAPLGFRRVPGRLRHPYLGES